MMTTHEPGSELQSPAKDPIIDVIDKITRDGYHLADLVFADDEHICEVVSGLLPGFVLGDLDETDEWWVKAHMAVCESCASELTRCQQLNGVLDELTVSHLNPPTPDISLIRAAYAHVDTPIGPLFVAATQHGVCEVSFAGGQSEREFCCELADRGLWPKRDAAAVKSIVDQLVEYFAGQRKHFDLVFDFLDLTPFSREVLGATVEIPIGEVRTYRDIAEKIGRPRATRAVGNALHRNPIPVIIPCHRVVRSDASIGGFGGGLTIKKQLLQLEGFPLSQLVAPSEAKQLSF